MNVKLALVASFRPFGMSLMAVTVYSSSFSKASIRRLAILSSVKLNDFTTLITFRVFGSRFTTELTDASSRFSISSNTLSMFFCAMADGVPITIIRTIIMLFKKLFAFMVLLL